MNKYLAVGLSMILALSFLSGCDSFVHETLAPETVAEPQGVDQDGIPYFTDVSALKSGKYYILRNGRYYSPVFFSTSFDTSSYGGSSRRRTAWFTEEEYASIPTLYDTDAIVFYYSTAFSENFQFERFYYNGYTVGICNLSVTPTGRYSFDATSENKNIDASSDAGRLLSIQANDVIIESIGKSELRAGNISQSGTIIGLNKDQYYSTELYVGSILRKFSLKADVIALSSAASYSITDYSYLQSTIAKINIPDCFESGYYSVNGSGIFRYLKGTREKTDAEKNTEIKVSGQKRATYDQQELIADDGAEKNVEFVVNREGNVTILVEYEEEPGVSGGTRELPEVRVISKDRVRVVRETEKGKITDVYYLATGVYTLSIKGMAGRAYKYIVMSEEQ